MLRAALFAAILGLASAAPAPNAGRPVHVRAPGQVPKDWELPPPSVISGSWWVSHTTGKANDGRINLQSNRYYPKDPATGLNYMQIDTHPGPQYIESIASEVNYRSNTPIMADVLSYTDASGKLHSLYGYDFFPSSTELAAAWQLFSAGKAAPGNYSAEVLAWGYDNELWQYMVVAIGPANGVEELNIQSRRKGGPDKVMLKSLADGIKALKSDKLNKLLAGGWHVRPTDTKRDGKPDFECTNNDCWGNTNSKLQFP